MNQSHSMIHQSIYQSESNPRAQKKLGPEIILESKARPMIIEQTRMAQDQLQMTKNSKIAQTSKFAPNKTAMQSKGPIKESLQTSKKDAKFILTSKNQYEEAKKMNNLRPNTVQPKLQQKMTYEREGQQNLPFIHYYEENIKLKKNQDQMSRQLEQLKNQLYEQSLVKKTFNERQLQMLAQGKKNMWDITKDRQPKKINSVQKRDQDNNKVTNLLEIIEHYKSKVVVQEEEIQNLRRQKHILEQDGLLKQKKADLIIKGYQDSQSKVNTVSMQEQLRNTTRLLQIQKQRNKFNEADIKRLEAKIRSLQMRQSEVEELRIQNRGLEEKIMKLTQLPSFGNVTDKIEEDKKYKQVQSKYKVISQKYNVLKNDHIKTQAELKVLRNQLIKANIEADQLEKQNVQLKKYSLENPVLSRLSQDHDLLAQVVYEIQVKKSQKLNKRQKNKSQLVKQSYQQIILQKEQLANELTTVRSKMAVMQQNWRQKQRLSKIEKQELISTFKQQAGSTRQETKIMSKNGVPYTDDVSMFTQDTVNLNSGSNYFDLFLGQLHLLETMLITVFNIRNIENALILATVDFYNHNTQTTRPVHGIHCSLQSEFSFKVTEDQFFFKYLNKGTFTIQVWASEGNKKINVGKATVDLRSLILKSRKNLAPVASNSAPIYMNQKVIGSINFVMRLRLPIFEQLQRINQIEQIVSTESAPNRKLIIQIQQGRGFAQSSNTFVYYPFRLEDYYTKTFKGSNPVWNHHKAIQLKYNNDLKNYLRKNELELVVLDDNAVITQEGDSDVVGTAHIPLVSLLQNKPIRQRLAVMKGAQRVGQIDVKIYWHETQATQIPLREAESIRQIIGEFLTKNKVQPEQIFYSIDKNNTGMVSFEEFLNWTLKLDSKVNYEMANQFYKQFKQPANLINFSAKLSELKQSNTNQIAKQLSQINKLVSQNTQMIKKKQKFEDYLKGKDLDMVSLDIDRSGNGIISRQQLQEYFDQHNIEPISEMSGRGDIKIVQFIKRYI